MWDRTVLSVEELKLHARNLALGNAPDLHKHKVNPLKDFKKDVKQLLEFSQGFYNDESMDLSIPPAAEWLLDHTDFLNEQSLYVKNNLPKAYYRRLPEWNHKSGITRIYVLLLEFLRNTDGQAQITMLLEYIQAFQEVAPLTIGELWAIPLVLRMSLIEESIHLFAKVYERHQLHKTAETLLESLLPYLDNGSEMEKALSLAEKELDNLPPALVVNIIGRLRDYGEEGLPIRRWLERKMETQADGLEKLVSFEHHLQARYQVAAGNLITSLHQVSRWLWQEHFERLSVVEGILRRDPSGVYPLMDFGSRDDFRHCIEVLAQKLDLPESLIAHTALNLAEQHAGDTETELNLKMYIGYFFRDEGEQELFKALQIKKPVRSIRKQLKKYPAFVYFLSVTAFTVIFLAIFLYAIDLPKLMLWQAAGLISLLLIPASEWGINIFNRLIQGLLPPDPFSRLEYAQGITDEAKTMVVIPAFLSNEKDIVELLQRLELHYLGNQDPNIHFAILGDFRDAVKEKLPEDEQVLYTASRGIQFLNSKYAQSQGAVFYLLQRKRVYNPREKIWMGWERKRGKLIEFNALLRGSTETTYQTIIGDRSIFGQIRYVITLDADTLLPRDAAKRLIGTLAHPLNRPVLNSDKTQVIRGYGLLQPRISVAHESRYRSRFAYWFAGITGIDPYAFSLSDTYQDLFGHGIFTGKGIYEVEIFDQLLRDRIQDNTVLSHDLLEGSFLRTGLVTDIELFDDYPTNYLSFMKRLHRWVRGDWQLLPWFASFVSNRDGQKVKADLPLISRWQMADNLRRSLLNPVLLLLFTLGTTVFPGAHAAWLSIILLTLAIPFLFYLAENINLKRKVSLRWRITNLLSNLEQILFSWMMLPYHSTITIDAIFRAVYRMFISKQKLLEWVTAAETEKTDCRTVRGFFRYLYPGIIVVIVFLGINSAINGIFNPGSLVCLIWLSGPWFAFWLSKPLPAKQETMTQEDQVYLRTLAFDIWRFFETVIGPEDHWLPPDNLQIDPPRGLAHRTSPTNIGLLLGCTVVARDFGYITTLEMIDRLEHTLDSMEQLDRWQGHLYNWYDTQSLMPLQPLYVSTVDSGNLMAYALAAKNGVKEWLEKPVVGPEIINGMLDRVQAFRREQEPNTALEMWAVELTEILEQKDYSLIRWYQTLQSGVHKKLPDSLRDKLMIYINELTIFMPDRLLEQNYSLLDRHSRTEQSLLNRSEPEQLKIKTLKDILQYCSEILYAEGTAVAAFKTSTTSRQHQQDPEFVTSLTAIRDILVRGERIQARLESFVKSPDLRPLYDPKVRLLSIGYNVSTRKLDKAQYDLMASEARQVSLMGVALGQIPTSHWFALGRTLVKAGKKNALLSWSGSMFEYFMPLLLMRSYPNTILEESYQAVADTQIAYASDLGMPWGISESGYYAFDFEMNYQYHAFGVPELGMKRGLEHDRVIAPYAAILAGLVRPKAAIQNLKVLETFKARGEFGFYEAVDFTRERIPQTESYLRVKSYMAHHQGMSFAALGQLLQTGSLSERFHTDPRIKATELLLQERIPQKPVVITKAKSKERVPRELKVDLEAVESFRSSDSPFPEARIISNGQYVVMLTNSGGGYSRFGNTALTRWREDPVKDSWGTFFYIHDVWENKLWSATLQPCYISADDEEMSFGLGKVTYSRTDGDIHTLTEVTVAAEWNAEVRSLSITNHGDKAHLLEITSYLEVVLSQQRADDAHPAFNKLFVQTEFSAKPEALLASRRARAPEDQFPWLAHSVVVEGNAIGMLEYETDRSAFLGRGHFLDRPEAIVENRKLSGKVGAVLDPIFALRRRIEIKPSETARITFVTATARTKEKVLDIIQKLCEPYQIQRTYQLAWTRSRIELRYLNLTARQADTFQWMLSQIFYFNPLRITRTRNITLNKKGQSSLWRYGISGDLPIVLVRIKEVESLDFVALILRAHEYWRLKGLMVDLLILNEFEGSYEQPLDDALRHLVYASSDRDFMDRPGGVFIRPGHSIPDEDKIVLETVARLSLNAEGGTLVSQLQDFREPVNKQDLLKSIRQKEIGKRNFNFACVEQIDLFNGYGGFADGGKEYAIVLYNNLLPPAPWSNVIANDSFGFQISETGAGYSWAENSRENKLTPWNNDPVLDLPGEVCYIRDEETGYYWSITPAPIREEETYIINHGWGYSRFEHQSHDIQQKSTVFVPKNKKCKIWILTLTNTGKEPKTLSVTYYVEWVLGVQREENAPYIVTEVDEETGALLARNAYQESFRDRVAYLTIKTSGEVLERSWTGDRIEFIGRNRSLREPAALRRAALSNSTGAVYNPCGAIQEKLVLDSGEERKVILVLGEGKDLEEVRQTLNIYEKYSEAETALNEVTSFWQHTLGQIQVQTPDKGMDMLLNGWLLYQVLACRMWARSGFYQAGGAYGFRDQLQDSLALLHTRPDLTRQQILLHAAHQFAEGDVQHWWHEETGRGIRTRFSDDLLWLPYAVVRYLELTGDESLLEEKVTFLKDDSLSDNEDERYAETRVSEEEGTIFDHCRRAIDHALCFGEHGLPLIGTGDWNDGMNRVGRLGKGESVWLGWFLYHILQKFSEYCAKQDQALELKYQLAASRLVLALEKEAWDGQWYRRAFTDEGRSLGSAQNMECQIDNIAQSWGVISEAASPGRAYLAMKSVDRELVRRDKSMVLLLTPPFNESKPGPGYIQGYPSGIRENGGQYTHGAIWSIIAWAKMGEGEKAWELFQMLNPINHALTQSEVQHYKVEPYVMAADIYAAEPNAGRGGWTWYTGAAGWMYQAGIEWILGIQRHVDRLYLRPCIPAHWSGFKLDYRYGSTTYKIAVINPEGKNTCSLTTQSSGGTFLEIDGNKVEDAVEAYVILNDDGKVHEVKLIM